ncbi:MAG: bifunctional ADP-dependent NAD(P)H-hydrate dehydratase/NAD(P)H-hydrate epimerase, partial [Deltaproteobacteria bacterium]|nr:bifunctional ADP-dependent NAD(P)H-hydrate dehydratase/NAD(P)H-hydrate epimerase [Deltaproteobacteria bacterium]
MKPLLTAEEMRALDAGTIRDLGLPGAVLMETAGRGVFRSLLEQYGEQARGGSTAVVCGRGNNGGDGFVVARCLQNAGCRATAVLLGSREGVRGDAAVHLGAYLAGGGRLVEVGETASARAPEEVERASVLVDAVLGTGL